MAFCWAGISGGDIISYMSKGDHGGFFCLTPDQKQQKTQNTGINLMLLIAVNPEGMLEIADEQWYEWSIIVELMQILKRKKN